MSALEIRIEPHPVFYRDAMAIMDHRIPQIIAKQANELVWFLEHPALYTAGSSAKPSDLLVSEKLPVFDTRRGGQYTYHGPGQRIVYLCLNLKERSHPDHPDIRAYIKLLEYWIITSLSHIGIKGEIREGRIGIWVKDRQGNEAKIAAIGVHVKQWVTSHGIAINVHPNLDHFKGIVPCGIREYGVTSIHAYGVPITMLEFDQILLKTFEELFG